MLFAFLLVSVLLCPSYGRTEGRVHALRVADPVTPVLAEFITTEIARANDEDALAFLLEIDTPGGLDTAMREIIQAMLQSRIPVVVYVYPPGARAASAGALIVLGADFAAMAPGSNLGAAHPVSLVPGEKGMDKVMETKVVNDAVAYAKSLAARRGRDVKWAEAIVRESISTPAEEARKLGIIDLVVATETELLIQLDGKVYTREGKNIELKVAGASIHYSEMGWRLKILKSLSDPNVAYMLLMLGILGIFFEISQPGVILPGTIGVISLLLAFFAFKTLPINYVGVLLILFAFVFFVLEVKVVSFGMLTVAGIVSLSLGSLILVDSSEPYLQISRAVIAASVAVCSMFFVLALYFVVRTQRTRFVSGAEGFVGEIGEAVTDIAETGKVFVHGEYWEAFSAEPIEAAERIEVVRLASNLRLEVRKIGKTT